MIFKKTSKKKSPEAKYYDYLISLIENAFYQYKKAIYVTIEKDEEEDWLLRFAETRNYTIRADAKVNGKVVYKIFGWDIDND